MSGMFTEFEIPHIDRIPIYLYIMNLRYTDPGLILKHNLNFMIIHLALLFLVNVIH